MGYFHLIWNQRPKFSLTSKYIINETKCGWLGVDKDLITNQVAEKSQKLKKSFRHYLARHKMGLLNFSQTDFICY